MNKNKKRKFYLCLIVISSFCLLINYPAFAIPTLQLDIEGGTYDLSTETIVAPGNPFTLFAYLYPDKNNTLSDYYYISAALIPKTGPDGDELGSFTINGNLITVTRDMIYGVPPLEIITNSQGWDAGDLPEHGIYPTYFKEFEFQFNSSQISPYNTQERARTNADIQKTGEGMYYVTFSVDTSSLNPNYVIHFDQYNKKLISNQDVDVSEFAPFSHDAESKKVPEPSTMLLLGSGLLALGLLMRLRKRTV